MHRPSRARNLLFVMCDQLRADHLSCYGHPSLKTPAIDALAARGTLFENAFVQSGVCGPSRMSFYTGRRRQPRYDLEPRAVPGRRGPLGDTSRRPVATRRSPARCMSWHR
jgi:hypothetical protein